MEPKSVVDIYTNLAVPSLPLWGTAVGLAVSLPIAAYFGFLTGRRIYVSKAYALNPPSSLPGETTLGAMLALLGLLIAFTYGFVINWGDARVHAVTEEAAALGTAYLRADLLEDPGRTDLQDRIFAYALTRVSDDDLLATRETAREGLERTLAAQSTLWPATLASFTAETPAAVQTFVAGGITDVLDSHTRRAASISEPVPTIVRLMLGAAAVGAIFLVGNNAALKGRQLSWRTFFFAWLLGVVMYLISDIERPGAGMIRLNTDALRVAIADMEALRSAR